MLVNNAVRSHARRRRRGDSKNKIVLVSKREQGRRVINAGLTLIAELQRLVGM
jgi:hypothetical protein